MPSWKKVITSGSDATLNDITLSGDLSIPVAKKLYFGGSDHTYIGEDVDDRLRFFVGGDEFMRFTQQDAGGEIFSIYQDVYLSDSVPIHFGASNDLKIVHDGSNSVIKADGTGDLTIRQDTADKDILLRCDDGSGGVATYMKLDGSATKVQVDKNMVFSDDVQAQFGGNVDLRIYSDDSNSYIDNENNDLIIQNDATDKDIILKTDDGSGGVTPYLTLNGSDTTIDVAKNMDFADNVNARFGASNDMNIVHDGTDTFIDNYTGDLIIQNDATDKDIILKTDDGSGGVTPYITLDGSAGLTQIDKNMKFIDSVSAYFGNSSDLQIFHNGTNSFGADNYTGHLIFQNRADDSDIIFKTDDGSGGVATYLTLDGSSTTVEIAKDTNVTGTLTATGDVVAYYSSDKRLKDNIVRIENPLEKVGKIGGYTFDWNDKQETYTGKDVGVIAQEIQEVLPELVTERDNGYLAVKYEKMVPLLIESIKELKQEIDDIKQKCDCLNN